MRHRVAKKKLNRTSSHRKALLRNLSTALLEHGKVETTLAKAKFVRPYIEKLVTKAKKDSSFTTVQRVKARLYSDDVVRKLFEEIVPKYKTRNGGYTRIVKLGFRDGDKAEMARIEFVEDKKPTKTKKAENSTSVKVKKETKTKKAPAKSKAKASKTKTTKKESKKETKTKSKAKPAKEATDE